MMALSFKGLTSHFRHKATDYEFFMLIIPLTALTVLKVKLCHLKEINDLSVCLMRQVQRELSCVQILLKVELRQVSASHTLSVVLCTFRSDLL